MDSKTLNSHPTSSASASKLLFASPSPSCQPPLPPRFNHLDHLRSMSCSIPNTAGTSDWLRRLRISRGFPDTDKMGFEQFLCSNKKDDSETCTDSVLLKTPQSKNADGYLLLAPLPSGCKRKRTVRTVKIVDQDFKVADPVEEEEKGHLDLLGCSQTEFTVIDTSLPSWKYGKNVWRDGDKGVMSCDRKKGKAMVRSKCEGHDQGKTMAATSEKKLDNCSQVQEKRVLKKQIDGGSSVILIKSIPITNKKDMPGISKSCVKLQK